MAALTHGMDIAQVRQSMKTLTRLASDIDGKKTEIQNLVNNLSNIWSGQDVQQFQGLWSSDYANKLSAIVASLTEFAQSGEKQATAQETTSNA